jgi:hypothetical protein
VTLSGAAAGPAAPASSDTVLPSIVAAAGPSEQVLPLWQLQVVPEHAQFPEHVSWSAAALLDPHPSIVNDAIDATNIDVPANADLKR